MHLTIKKTRGQVRLMSIVLALTVMCGATATSASAQVDDHSGHSHEISSTENQSLHSMEGWYPPDVESAPMGSLTIAPNQESAIPTDPSVAAAQQEIVAEAFAFPPGPLAPTAEPNPVDSYSTYDPQDTCDPTVKPGTQYLLNLAMKHYGQGRSSGIVRACDIGGTSEHKEGRAFDWAVNVNNAAQKQAGDQFVTWLTARGPDGKVGYQARRLGVMYIIWNRQIWSNTSSNASWRVYTGPVPHTDHVHVSMSWSGAQQKNSWWTGYALPSNSDSRKYVENVYQDLFNRPVDPAGMQGWTSALANGTPRVAVANAITSSPEYRSRLINKTYQEFLGRNADPVGAEHWLKAMNNGMKIQELEAGFIASPEYFAKSNSNNSQWVRNLYRDVLKRPAADSEVQGWVKTLANGASRQDVSYGFLLSTERLSTVVNGYYMTLLNRGIDPVGRHSWVTAIQGGARSEAIIGGIIASEEYYAKA